MMIAILLSLILLDDSDLPPIPEIVATLKAEKESLLRLTRSRVASFTPGTQVLMPIKRYGEKIIPALKELLTDESPLVRRNGIFALGYLNDVAAEKEIILMLKDKAISVRIDAAENLSMLHDKEIRDALLQALTDDAPRVRQQVIDRFCFYGKAAPIRQAISSSDRNSIIQALSKLVDDPDTTVREHLCYTLGTYRESNTSRALLQLIRDEKPEVRARAARALGTTDNPLVVSHALLTAVSDKKEIALAAIYSLGELTEPLATMPLVEALTNPELRRQSVIALGLIRDRRATEPLIPYLSDEDSSIRHATAIALGKIGDERALEPLIKAFTAEKEQAYLMVPALGEFNSPRVIEPLVRKMFSAQDSYMAKAGVEVLKRIQHPDAIRIPVEAAIAKPDTHAAFAIRSMTGHRFNAESFAAWWRENTAHYKNAIPSAVGNDTSINP